MKFVALAFCLLHLTFNVSAQTTGKPVIKKFFFHSHGISFQKFEILNQRVAAYPQFEQPKSSTGTLQFGTFCERNRLITGYSVNGGSSLSGDRKRKSTAISFFGLSADVGYVDFRVGNKIIALENMDCLPYMGEQMDHHLKYKLAAALSR